MMKNKTAKASATKTKSFKCCAGCPTPAKCKMMGKCLAKKAK